MAESSPQPADTNDEPPITLNERTATARKPITTSNSAKANDDMSDAAATPTESKGTPTPEQQKRLATLQAKRSKLTRNQAQLARQKHAALLRFAAALPASATDFLDLPEEPGYTPSTIAHTIQPALAHLDDEDQTALMGEASKIIKDHIRMLHEYNEIKDVAQGLIGMIADQRGKRVVDVEGEFGVGKGD